MGSIYTSFTDIFRVGVGPSSSHTVGPMRGARHFVVGLARLGVLGDVRTVKVELWGSLGATGIGHHTPNAIMAGLQGFKPNTYEKDKDGVTWDELTALPRTAESAALRHPADATGGSQDLSVQLKLLDGPTIRFSKFDFKFLASKIHPVHTNCFVLTALDADERVLHQATYLSVGGGAVEFIDEQGQSVCIEPKPADMTEKSSKTDEQSDFNSSDELVNLCLERERSIADLARQLEAANFDSSDAGSRDAALNQALDQTWAVMKACIEAGLKYAKGECDAVIEPTLRMRRRAPKMWKHILELEKIGRPTRSELLSCFAIAVNERNATGNRIVTAPTAGAAGVVPAVLQYWLYRSEGLGWSKRISKPNAIREYLLTAAMIGSIIKANGSISGAECGCQAEIGSACAMAAAGLAAIFGGTPAQVENAAEIALEYHFGLTCDPVGGLVFIPCIERNAMAANTAVTAAELAMAGDGSHHVSLDTAISTMRQTGIDMNEAYKETSKAGLATHVQC